MVDGKHGQEYQKTEHVSFWYQWKDSLQFSAKKTPVKTKDMYPFLLMKWIDMTKPFGSSYLWLLNNLGSYSYTQARFMEISGIGFVSARLFLKSLRNVLQIPIPNPDVIPNERKYLVSGILNIFYKDSSADDYDNYGVVPSDFNFEELLDVIKTESNNPQDIIDHICGYRKLYKKRTYVGAEYDAQMKSILLYQSRNPSKKALFDTMWKLRKENYPSKHLGELNGWKKIRKSRNRLFVEKGVF